MKGKFTEKWEVVKLVLVLSHGNAVVESVFSVENLKEKSLTRLRTVYNAIQFNGGIINVPITNDLLTYAEAARSRYHLALEKQKKKKKCWNKTKKTSKCKISKLIKILQKEKSK